jgi:hypothetical protein
MARKTKAEKMLAEYVLTFGPRQLFERNWHPTEVEWMVARSSWDDYREYYKQMQALAIKQGWPESGGFRVELKQGDTYRTIVGDSDDNAEA